MKIKIKGIGKKKHKKTDTTCRGPRAKKVYYLKKNENIISRDTEMEKVSNMKNAKESRVEKI